MKQRTGGKEFCVVPQYGKNIRILKEYVGYTAWSEVPMTERGYCFRGYNAKSVVPEWDLEEETYNN